MNEHQLLKNLENNSLVTSPPEETDATVDPQAAAETLRRSQRTRKLTAKGQELQDSKSKRLQHLFTVAYDKWKTQAKEVKKALNKSTSSELLRELVSTTCKASTDVKQTYEDLRQYCTPDGETRRRVDTCDAISKQIEEYASNLLEEKDKEQGANSDQVHWDGTSSVLSSAISSRFKSRSKGSKSASSSYVSTRHSSLCSAMKQDAAAELAATRATLQALKEIECEKQKLESLEVENKQRLALQEAENIARQNTLEEKRREILRLETVKQMNAAKARLQVYEQGDNSDEEISELLYSTRLNQSTPVPKKERPPVQCTASPLVTQVQSASNSKPDNSAISLAEAIAESINSSRLPAPEPSIFTGDPLRYKDWKMSFQTLIGRKNIPVNEKVYYLRKYVGGSARKAIESYFLLSTDEAYHSAWEVLEERYGSPFVIAKAFRDKLNSWPKIGPKESIELREFSDFLRACEAAMSQVKCLEILNDCSENQKMITKLPDWLAARWNRKVIEFEEERKMFPTFNLFVDFVTREAKIACNPVTSLHALKSGDGEKMKTLKIRSVGAKVLTSNSEEASDTKSCIFCERSTHSLHTCRKFMERTAELTPGCLQVRITDSSPGRLDFWGVCCTGPLIHHLEGGIPASMPSEEMFGADTTTSLRCQNCWNYLQEITELKAKIFALEMEKGLHETLPITPGGKKTKSASTKCSVNYDSATDVLNLDDTVSFPKLMKTDATWHTLGAKPKINDNISGVYAASPGIQLRNKYQPLSELAVNEPVYNAVNKKWDIKNKTERETKTKHRAHRGRESVSEVKDKDVLLLGDGAISDVKNERMLTCSYPSATVTDITGLLPQVMSNHPGVKQIILHVGAVDTTGGESELLKKDFSKLLEILNKLEVQSFISGPLPNIDRRINKFSRLLALNAWVSKTCETHAMTFIDNFNLFWERDDLFKGRGPHLNGRGLRRLTDSLLHSVRHQNASDPPWAQPKAPLQSEHQLQGDNSRTASLDLPTSPPPLQPCTPSAAPSSSSPLGFPSHMESLVKSGIKMVPLTPNLARSRVLSSTLQHPPASPQTPPSRPPRCSISPPSSPKIMQLRSTQPTPPSSTPLSTPSKPPRPPPRALASKAFNSTKTAIRD
ncbi:uncharacterized protein LOC114445917 [Parambassis ranga]|uniref:Uncharacterized protein LOC114445917 n=1 Tax=Parambassis ranga TaxID=210632 RepID=A0A6P7JJU9_9TELE|nr:uncharacterized protein LOC114445917 [Parambassis ranga]